MRQLKKKIRKNLQINSLSLIVLIDTKIKIRKLKLYEYTSSNWIHNQYL